MKEILINNVATKGRAYHLLKTKSIGKRKRKDVTQHEADLSRFRKKKLVVPFQRSNQTMINFLQKKRTSEPDGDPFEEEKEERMQF